MPNDVWQELQALGGAPQPADASNVAASVTVQKLLVGNLVAEVKEFGRFPPKKERTPNSEEERTENKLAGAVSKKVSKNMSKMPNTF